MNLLSAFSYVRMFMGHKIDVTLNALEYDFQGVLSRYRILKKKKLEGKQDELTSVLGVDDPSTMVVSATQIVDKIGEGLKLGKALYSVSGLEFELSLEPTEKEPDWIDELLSDEVVIRHMEIIDKIVSYVETEGTDKLHDFLLSFNFKSDITSSIMTLIERNFSIKFKQYKNPRLYQLNEELREAQRKIKNLNESIASLDILYQHKLITKKEKTEKKKVIDSLILKVSIRVSKIEEKIEKTELRDEKLKALRKAYDQNLMSRKVYKEKRKEVLKS